MINLDTNLQNKKLLVTKTVTIMNQNLYAQDKRATKCTFRYEDGMGMEMYISTPSSFSYPP